MQFEFDAEKSAGNLQKHGISFDDAVELWRDPQLIEIPARTQDEARFLVIARLGQTCWAAVITYRSENVRIISVRRARKEEVEIYEG